VHSDDTDIQYATAAVNGIDLHYAHAGAGPLVVFLHGSPSSTTPSAASCGSSAPTTSPSLPTSGADNLSSKPEGVHSCGIWPAVEDLRALVEHLGYERFLLVGHDWGSLVAWSFALHYP
jgi:pimeloyl-ACP methyl ester carboxylesterase